jgi:hypothetical protein
MALYFNRGRSSPYTFERLQADQDQVPSQSSIRSRFQAPTSPLDIDGGLGGLDTPGNRESLGSSLRRAGGITDPGGAEPNRGAGGYSASGPGSDTPSVVNYENKTNIDTPLGKVAARDVALSAFPSTMQKGIGLAADALSGALGPYGVVGGPVAPDVGTQAFAQQTPALDTAPGVPDPGHQAASMSETGNPAGVAGPTATGLGGTFSSPSVPGSFGGGGPGDPGASVSSAGHNAAGAATSDVGTTSAGVAGNVGAGNMGGGDGGAAGAGSGGEAGSGGSGATGPDGPAGSGQGAF